MTSQNMVDLLKIKILICALIFPFLSSAQEDIKYQKPSSEILQLADYERPPSVIIDSKKEYMIMSFRSTYKTLDDLNQEELRLGGLRINPVVNISSTVTYINNLKVRKVSDKDEIQVIGLPANPRIANMVMSPDEKKMAFTHSQNDGLELWVLDIARATAKKLSNAGLNGNLGNPISWFNDNNHLLIKKLPSNRSALKDPKKEMPNGPIVSVASGAKSSNRTFQDLLKNKLDEANFEILVTSELYKIDLDGKETLFKPANLYVSEQFSPDGNYLLISTIQKPFSYIVPYSRFPMKSNVYTSDGKEVKQVNDVPLTEIMPKGFMATRTGKRNMSWRNDKPSSLYFVEALDGGDPAIKVEFRDELFTWDAPFNKEPNSVMKVPQRFGGVIWGNDDIAIVFDQWYDTRNTKTYQIKPSDINFKPIVLADRNSQDVYSDPGQIETERNRFGRYSLAILDNKIFYLGEGHTEKGQFPFIDEYNFVTKEKKRLYQSSSTDKMETLFSFIDIKRGEVLVQIQSKTQFPNYYIRNIKKRIQVRPITFLPNPFKSIESVHKEVLKYKRKDSLDLSGTLYLPAGYDTIKKEKLPLLIWAYPQEFKDKNSASQNTQNPNEFTFPNYGSFVYWVNKGYIVLDDAAFPIVGEGETEPNDNFINQLVADAEAAIDAVDKLGYVDRKKVAIGGHSYGAFMTANLLTHSKLFACGIARSGAYNRTLTPFGFQSEQRNYWEASNVYNTMSPFMNAEKMKTPILLVHGEADNNPGTFTLQTERYFQALKGLGAPARMVILPKESHGYAAKENILHLLWEQDQFFEKYLKNKKAE